MFLLNLPFYSEMILTNESQTQLPLAVKLTNLSLQNQLISMSKKITQKTSRTFQQMAPAKESPTAEGPTTTITRGITATIRHSNSGPSR